MDVSEKLRVRFTYEASGPRFEDCDIADLAHFDNIDDVRAEVMEWAEETATVSATPNEDDIAALWAAVQKLREREG